MTAVAQPSSPRELDIIFTNPLSSSALLLASFCENNNNNNNGRLLLKLQAPSRIMRESFLLALGIANFSGKPSDLTVSTVLFQPCRRRHHRPPPSFGTTTDTPEKNCGHSITTKNEEANNSPLPTNDTKNASEQPIDTHAPTVIEPFSSPKKSSEQTSIHTTTTTTTARTNNTESSNTIQGGEKKMQALEQAVQNDMRMLRDKLEAKDRILYDLQQRLIKSDQDLRQARNDTCEARREIEISNAKSREYYKDLRLSHKRMESYEADISRLKRDLNVHHSNIEKNSNEQKEKEQEYMKSMKALENEKAVLSAAVEARGTKLKKMEDLKTNLSFAQKEISKGQLVKNQLHEMTSTLKQVKDELSKKDESEKHTKNERDIVTTELKALKKELEAEKKYSNKYKTEMEKIRMKCQKFKGERNTMKQKSDSLAKEMSRICRNGRGINEIEKIIHDEETRKMEVQVLTQQKRKAIEEVEVYRAAFESSLRAHGKANIPEEAIRALEQKTELERVLSDLTEYVNAKEMQLETMKEVNQSLTEELQLQSITNFRCEKDVI